MDTSPSPSPFGLTFVAVDPADFAWLFALLSKLSSMDLMASARARYSSNCTGRSPQYVSHSAPDWPHALHLMACTLSLIIFFELGFLSYLRWVWKCSRALM